MNRRIFLRLTGLLAGTAGVWALTPAAAQTIAERPNADGTWQSPGMYQISGVVRLDAPLVQISGISNAQQITWSGSDSTAPKTAGFSTFESFDQPWQMPDIRVRGGTLQALSVVPVTWG